MITICVGMLCACSSSDNGGGGTNMTISAIGGTGSNGSGGNGGEVFVISDAAIKVLKSGSADASFDMPAESSYEFGTHGYTVSGNEEILLDTDVPANYAGLYVVSGQWNLYKADGTGSLHSPNLDYTVTGLRVPSRATLTINANDHYFTNAWFGVLLVFNNDIVIDGTLKTAAGYNLIYFDNTSSSSNNIVVTGTVTTSGEPNGQIQLAAGKHFYNSGTIDASGGDNATGGGYSSYGIEIYAYTGSIYSKGTIKANGGNAGGTTGGSGGNASEIYLYGGENGNETVDPINGGSVIVSGTIEAKGGSAGGTTGGSGGGQGALESQAYGGDTIVNASINISGGNAVGTGNTGGTPSEVIFGCSGVDYRRVGVCQISGSFTVNGGNGETGGHSGMIIVSSGTVIMGNSQSNSLGQAPDVELFGFTNINVSGGDGTTKGGDGGAAILGNFAPHDDIDDIYLPAYPIISEANFTAKGGNATASNGTGGQGGQVGIFTDYENDYTTSITTVTQSGTIDNSGGNATASGGTGGDASLISLGIFQGGGDCWNVTTTGKLISKGGNGALKGGTGGYIDLFSNNIATVYTLANLSVNGGTGTTPGSTGSADVDGNPKLP